MASALSSVQNAVVTFEVAGVGIVTDPATGNVSPSIKTLAYDAFLKAVSVDPQVYPGINVDATIFEGYVIKPLELDDRIGVGTQGSLTFGTALPVQFEVVRARLGYGNTGALGERLSSILGTRITLWARDK